MKCQNNGDVRLKKNTAKVVLFLGLLCGLAVTMPAAEHYVSSKDDIRDLTEASSIQPGDTVIWRDGTYIDQNVNFNASGTENARITLRAETPGGVTLKGKSFIKFGGDYLTVDGFRFYNGDDYNREVSSAVIQFRANNGNRHAHYCRLTNTSIIDMNSHEQDVDDDDEDGDTTEFIFHSSKWIQIYGTNHRIDHCTFAGKKVRGALIVAELIPQDGESGTPYAAYNHQIDHNRFGPNPVGFVDNEFETVRLGTSDYANYNGNSVVEYNHFYQCNGEIEVISNKSSNNTYRYNTIEESQGSLVMRHGDGCVVEGNVILGNDVANTGGIRLNGQDHVVRNNYVAGVQGTGLRAALVLRKAGGVSTGDTNGGYEQVRFAQITHNTFVNNRQTFNLAESGSKDNSREPTASTIANNVLVSTSGPLITSGSVPTSMTYAKNMVFGATVGFSHSGFVTMDPGLLLGANNIYRPSSSSAVRGWGDPAHAATLDFDGQARAGSFDVGSDQFKAGDSAPAAPRSGSQVGTSWDTGFFTDDPEDPVDPDPEDPVEESSFLANLAIRAQMNNTTSGQFTPINPGFVISGTGSKRVLIRAIGPTLRDFGVTDAIDDPTLTLFNGASQQIGFNDNWDSSNGTAIVAANSFTGAFALAAGAKDAALLVDLPVGLYTARVGNVDNGDGVALLELYDADRDGDTNQLANVSARAFVGTGNGILVPGIVVDGTVAKRYLIRAVGPGLAEFGVTGTLSDPVLEVLSGQTVIASNDNWQTATNSGEVATVSATVGAFALTSGSADAALVVELAPGVYTARVKGAANTTGEVLVEVYAISSD